MAVSPLAIGESVRECWTTFAALNQFADLSDIREFSLEGNRLQVPSVYLGAGTPSSVFSGLGALRLLAWPPNLAPLTEEQSRTFWTPPARGAWISFVSYPNTPADEVSFQYRTRSFNYVNRGPSPEAPGFDSHIVPDRPHHPEFLVNSLDKTRFFECNQAVAVQVPSCIFRRSINSDMYVRLSFPRQHLGEISMLEANFQNFVWCSLLAGRQTTTRWPLSSRPQ